MKLILESETIDTSPPIVIKIGRNGSGTIVVKARGYTLLRITEQGICRFRGVGRDIGFPLDCESRIKDITYME